VYTRKFLMKTCNLHCRLTNQKKGANRADPKKNELRKKKTRAKQKKNTSEAKKKHERSKKKTRAGPKHELIKNKQSKHETLTKPQKHSKKPV
jgi:hypothetical protein